MKIEKIQFNKIKVTFTPEDLVEHNLSPKAVKENAPWVQRLLMSVVKKTEEEIGFCAEGARLMVEAMPGDDDSMVMYITRLDDSEALNDAINTVKRRLRLKVKPKDEERNRFSLISFESFDDAIKLSHFAKDTEGGNLYFYDGRYHIVIESDAAIRFGEFGVRNPDAGACDIVCEHGKLVASNALKTLREYF